METEVTNPLMKIFTSAAQTTDLKELALGNNQFKKSRLNSGKPTFILVFLKLPNEIVLSACKPQIAP